MRCLLDPVLFWTVFGRYEGERIELEEWQCHWLDDRSKLRAVEKAPQIGFSWVCALEALHEVLMFSDALCGFISVDQREATEKILYAKKLYEDLPGPFQEWVPMIKDAAEEIWFGDSGRPSRLASYPATAGARGRKMSVYLDEVDFYKDGGAASLRAAMGRITRGGRVTMGSTCFGMETQLAKTMQEDKNFSKALLPWSVAKNPEVLENIALSFETLELPDFVEEYECTRGGNIGLSFDPDMLRKASHQFPMIDPLEYNCENDCFGGYDVGKSGNPSVLSIMERHTDNKWRQMVLFEPRDSRTGKILSLPAQYEFLQALMMRVPRLTLALDIVGIGAQMGQGLKSQFGNRMIEMYPGSKPEGLPTQEKHEIAIEMKKGLEAEQVEISQNKELFEQFRRTRIRDKVVDQPGTRKKSHYDRFWATAYNWYAVMSKSRQRSIYSRRGLQVAGARPDTRARLMNAHGRRRSR